MQTVLTRQAATVLAVTRREWRLRAVHRVLGTLAKVGNLAWNFGGAVANVETIRDVSYGTHPVAHLLDIYRPRFAPRPLPVLLYIHGGAFVICSKDTHRFLAMHNAERAGYLVFSINYRLAPSHRFPAAIEDACDAYRWVVQNAARYGGDPQRIVIAGESAGGNLALGVAIAATYKRPEEYARRVYDLNVPPVGVMPLMPYLQVSDPGRRAAYPGVSAVALSVARSISNAYLEDAKPCEKTLMADPIRVLEECPAPAREFPPVFSGVGTADLCCADVLRLEAACNKLHVPVQAFYYENEYHVFHTAHWRIAARAFWRESIGFLVWLALQPKKLVRPVAAHRPHDLWSNVRRLSKRTGEALSVLTVPAFLAAGTHSRVATAPPVTRGGSRVFKPLRGSA